MTLEDIIESINNYIESARKDKNVTNRQHLVLQRTITPEPTFPVYKQYQFVVWVVDDSNKEKLFTMQHKDKVSSSYEETLIKDLEIKFLTQFLGLLFGRSSFDRYITPLKDIVYGEYKSC